MLRTTKNIKERYEKIQNYIFSLIPEKWEEIYLYASVPFGDEDFWNTGKKNKENEPRGELFFYYLPKGILKMRPINVYEVPQRFNINEEQYLKIVEELYNSIKDLQHDFIETEQEIWTNLTISIANFKFKVEYMYDELPITPEQIHERNVIWMYKYLKHGGDNKEDRKILDNYYTNMSPLKKETYETGIYLKTDNNTITFDKEESNNAEFVIYEKDEIANILNKTKNKIHHSKEKKQVEENEPEEEKGSKNQILF